jgi:hypothetical protein
VVLVVVERKYGKVQEAAQKIPDDEPVFVLRGQDLHAPGAIEHYAVVCFRDGLTDHADAAMKAAGEITLWQAEHPERVKRPD